MNYDFDLDERYSIYFAGSSISRFDQLLTCNANIVDIISSSLIRRESIGISSIDGNFVIEEDLSRVVYSDELTMLDRNIRKVSDIFKMLNFIHDFNDEIDSYFIQRIFMTGDYNNNRLMKTDTIWSLEDDSTWLFNYLEKIMDQKDPWTAIEFIRQIWVSGRFFGTSRKMALSLSPLILQIGFGLNNNYYGLSNEIKKHTENLRRYSEDKDEWFLFITHCINESAKNNIEVIKNVNLLKETVSKMCQVERSTSSVDNAIFEFMKTPIFNIKKLAERLDLSQNGAKIVLDKLIEKNIIEQDDFFRNKSYIFKRIFSI